MITDKKQLELAYLLHFKESFAGLPKGRIESTERPDYIVHHQQGSLGIELRELFHPAPGQPRPHQAHENMEELILRQAESVYNASLGPPVLVSVQFASQISLAKSAVPGVARELSRLIAEAVESLTGPLTIYNRWPDHQRFPEPVVSITVARFPHITQARWSSGHAGWVWQSTPSELQAVIDEKNALCSAYRQRCDELWLLLVAANDAPSRFVELADQSPVHKFTTEFDRVFWFNAFSRGVVEFAKCGPDKD